MIGEQIECMEACGEFLICMGESKILYKVNWVNGELKAKYPPGRSGGIMIKEIETVGGDSLATGIQ